ncbi:DNA-invertase hin [Moraxella lacunata]|uniref:DNA-invertase hin n=1 Tax=Moraxella lacunata TaxID=477 RepID=A0A378UBW2_MORLA|nr:recombinase family protein [Moraxella lacunata]STZ74868.1 DNA-invertase hin [Moraxella lacunata]
MKDPLDQDRTIDIDELSIQKVQTIGYIRVSTIDQKTDRQLDGVALDRIFTDKMTGATKDRPQLKAMLDYVRYGDTVMVHSLDRLARNFDDLLAIINQLAKKGVTFKSLQENITINGTNTSPIDTLILHIFGAIAQFNRSLIREAQREGIAKAKQKGVYKGRKSVLTDENIAQIEALLAQRNSSVDEYKKISHTDIAKQVGISKSSLYRYLGRRQQTEPKD